ncbi:rRNA maturation RNase YbeY [Maribacter thermophilus]|uniref:rRNA maturation RNase YbeY n=1 Tax=Maribacter thermophilus TaxID=1197874 RepID=UPI000640BB45|nr:rRNA maturation RNase YbeY [Maribacter thermophilus]
MIDFHYETDFSLSERDKYSSWINSICKSEEYSSGELNYIFCDDAYLLNINQQYLQHDTYTDIITFDYTSGKVLSGDIYISVERVKENSIRFNVSFENELLRVMAHGILHLMGYKDKKKEDIKEMRKKEEEKINMFHVEHK